MDIILQPNITNTIKHNTIKTIIYLFLSLYMISSAYTHYLSFPTAYMSLILCHITIIYTTTTPKLTYKIHIASVIHVGHINSLPKIILTNRNNKFLFLF